MTTTPENPFAFTTDTSQFRGSVQSATDAARAFTSESQRASQSGRQFGNAIGSAFEGLVFKGKSLSDTFRSLSLNLSQIAFRQAFKPLEQGIGNILSGAMTGGGSGIASMFGGGQGGLTNPFSGEGAIATPSFLSASKFSGAVSGDAVSNASFGAASPNVTFNVTASDAESFQRSEAQISALLARAVSNGQRNL